MTNTLKKFEAILENVIGNPCDMRPFVCEGSPLHCNTFIVRFNPATRLDCYWWDYWKSGHGFQKKLWQLEYSVQRENGKTSKLESALMLLSTSFLVVRFLKPALFHTLQRKTASIQT